MAQSTIGSLESGTRQTGRKIVTIANALEVDPLWLAEGRGEPVASGPGGLRAEDFMPVDVFHAENPRVVLIPKVRLKLSGWRDWLSH